MVKRHHSKKTHRRKHSSRARHTRKRGGVSSCTSYKRGGYRGGLGSGPAFTSGASQVLKQMAPAPIRGGFKKMANTLKRLLHF
jgi:hypothetical protein